MKYTCLLSIALTVLGCGKAGYDLGDKAAEPSEADKAREVSRRIDPSGTVTDSGAGKVLSNSGALQ
ncbi:MAG: hypothetical protein V3V75_02575, partial [Thermoguttaceae bacterium]